MPTAKYVFNWNTHKLLKNDLLKFSIAADYCQVLVLTDSIPETSIPMLRQTSPGIAPVLNWRDKASIFNKYQLQYANNSSFKNAITVNNISGQSYQLPNMFETGSYFCRVKAVNALGKSSQWSPAAKFSVQDVGQLNFVRPANYRNNAIEKLAFWDFYSYGTGGFITGVSKKRDHEKGMVYKCKNRIDGTYSYWTSRRLNGAMVSSCTPLIEVKKGDAVEFSSRLKASENIKGSLGIIFYRQSDDSGFKIVKTCLSEKVTKAGFTKVKAKGTAPYNCFIGLYVSFKDKGEGFFTDPKFSINK